MTLRHDIRQVVKQKRLLAYLASGFFSNVGTWVQRLTMGWLVFEMTASIAWVGVVAACEVLPAVCLQPVAGVLIDRFSRTRTLAFGNALSFLQAASLAVFYAAGMLDITLLVASATILGLLEGINQPARLTIISEFSHREGLRVAISLNSLSFNLARFVGPLLASVFLTRGEAMHAFALNAASFLPMICLMLRVRLSGNARFESPSESVGRAFLSGLRYIRDHPVIFDLLCLAVIVSLCCRSLIELLPAISGYWYNNNPVMLSVLTSSVACGALLGGIWILTRRDMKAILQAVVLMCGMSSLSSMVMSAGGSHLVIASISAFCLGLSASGSAVGMQNLVHYTVPSPYLGRTMAVYGLVQRGGAVIGAVLLGFAADAVGLPVPVFAAAALAAFATLIFARRIATLSHRLDELQHEHAGEKIRHD